MTPQEERLVLELHSKWGNRWSRIAKKLPGRTDNEIKNYWRTHMRKNSQEMRKRIVMISSSSSSSSLCDIDSSSSMSAATEASMDSFPYDLHYVKSDQNIGKNKGDGGDSSAAHLVNGPGECEHKEEDALKDYPMEQIWKEIASTEMVSGALLDENFRFDGGTFPGTPMHIPSPVWDYQSYEEFESPVWKMNEESLNLWFPTAAHVFNYQHTGDNK